MTLVAPEHHRSPDDSLAALPKTRLNVLERQIQRAIGSVRPDLDDDSFLPFVLDEAIDAFVRNPGSPAEAAEQVADTMRAIGERHARLGLGPQLLTRAFESAQVAAQKGLQMALGDAVTGPIVIRLRQDLMAYVGHLHHHARTAWARMRRALTLSEQDRLAALRTSLFGSRTMIDQLLEISGFDPRGEMRAVVSVEEALPQAARRHRCTIAGNDPRELLVPSTWDVAVLESQLTGQAVIGPPTGLDALSDAIELARHAARLLHDGTETDDRVLVPFTDLTATLAVHVNGVLAELLIDLHLKPLESLPLGRRLDLGELLLVWLERGLSIAALARELCIPPQTAHNRMTALRSSYGDALQDGRARYELVLALRTALPRWRAEAAACSPRGGC